MFFEHNIFSEQDNRALYITTGEGGVWVGGGWEGGWVLRVLMVLSVTSSEWRSLRLSTESTESLRLGWVLRVLSHSGLLSDSVTVTVTGWVTGWVTDHWQSHRQLLSDQSVTQWSLIASHSVVTHWPLSVTQWSLSGHSARTTPSSLWPPAWPGSRPGLLQLPGVGEWVGEVAQK